jgi:hypothetical protein
MPVDVQSLTTATGITWLFIVNAQVITKCFSSIHLSSTSTLLIEKHTMPKYLKLFNLKLFPSTTEPSFIHQPNQFPILQTTVLSVCFLLQLKFSYMSKPCSLACIPLKYKHLSLGNTFTLSSTDIFTLSALSFMGAGQGYFTAIPAGAIARCIRDVRHLGVQVKPISNLHICARCAFCWDLM